jgi:glycosyltransferase involved in cell wall biosynthesis
MNYIRLWDRASADRPDKIIANSRFVSQRIKKYFKRDSVVINPPVEVNCFKISSEKDRYFLTAGRLMAYKRFDIVIEAFNQLGLPLKIIGRGPELKRYKKIAKSNIKFLGRVSDEDLRKYFSRCQAFIFPQEEDFGITAIEAMASGTPLIAYRGGDILEHTEEGKAGIFFNQQTPEAIVEAVKKFRNFKNNPEYIRHNVLKFDKEIFKTKIKDYIEKTFEEFKKNN